MKKIVIDKEGLFNITHAALRELVIQGSSFISVQESEMKESGLTPCFEFFIVPAGVDTKLYREGKIFEFEFWRDGARECPILIDLIEKSYALSKKSNFHIVEIPSEIEYHIALDESGEEIIVENHKTWK